MKPLKKGPKPLNWPKMAHKPAKWAKNPSKKLRNTTKMGQKTPQNHSNYAVRVVDGRTDLRFSLYTQVKT